MTITFKFDPNIFHKSFVLKYNNIRLSKQLHFKLNFTFLTIFFFFNRLLIYNIIILCNLMTNKFTISRFLVLAGSSWYLLCENCREKYMKSLKTGKQTNFHHRSVITKKNMPTKSFPSPAVATNLEPHIIMKNNAMFLLDLASSADTSMTHQRRPSSSIMPSVSENISPPDYCGPFRPLPSFQCLNSFGVNLISDEPGIYNEMLQKNECSDNFPPGPSTSGQRVSKNNYVNA